MFSRTAFRFLGVPMSIVVLALMLFATASAGGGEEPTGPTVLLTPPSVALDGEGNVLVTSTLICWDEAVNDGHVSVSVGLAQQRASGGASLEATCAADPQVLTLPVASSTAHDFRPGPVAGIFEFVVVTGTSGGQGIGEIDQILEPPQAAR